MNRQAITFVTALLLAASSASASPGSSTSQPNTVPSRVLAAETVVVVAPEPPAFPLIVESAAKRRLNRLANVFWTVVAAKIAADR